MVSRPSAHRHPRVAGAPGGFGGSGDFDRPQRHMSAWHLKHMYVYIYIYVLNICMFVSIFKYMLIYIYIYV